jgi:hypothetical protein
MGGLQVRAQRVASDFGNDFFQNSRSTSPRFSNNVLQDDTHWNGLHCADHFHPIK